MKYYYSHYDGHREIFAVNDIEQRFICADCNNKWSPPVSIDRYSVMTETTNPQIPDTAVLLLGVELL
jgi:hypothetical protein